MIVYAVICRAKDAAILVDVSSPDLSGNVPQVMASFMEHLRDNPGYVEDGERKTFVHRNTDGADPFDFVSHFLEACTWQEEGLNNAADEHYFHLYLKDGVYYCCLGDDPAAKDQKVNFAFLQQVHKEFTKLFRPGRINRANAYGLDSTFKPNMRSQMHYHNVNHTKLAQEERVAGMVAKVSDMKDVMGRNINIMLQNGENANAMLQKSEMLQEDALVFKKRSSNLAWRQRRKLWFCGAAACVAFLLLVYFMAHGICGHGFEYCRAVENDNNGGGGGNYNDNGGNNQNNKNNNQNEGENNGGGRL